MRQEPPPSNAMAKDFSPDVLMDILLRLPSKFVARSRGVCKLWRSVTHDPAFIEQLYRRTPRDSLCVIIFATDATEVRLHRPDGVTAITSANPYKNRDNSWPSWRSSSCHGVVCFSQGSSIMLCNPATKERMTLRMQGLDKRSLQHVRSVAVGFSPVTGEYKVVLLHSDSSSSKILTLGTESWRMIKEEPGLLSGDHLEDGGKVFVGGAIYWPLYARGGFNSIIFFDLGNEMFGRIAVPVKDWSEIKRGCLIEMQGSLGLMRVLGKSTDIWMLKDRASQKWEKTQSIDSPVFSLGSPVAMQDGNLVIKSPYGVVWYDLKRKTKKIVASVRGPEKRFGLHLQEFYVLGESPVSLRTYLLEDGLGSSGI